MSVVAPAVYVGTWHKYNCGSIAGRWFDLTTFDDERDFFAACRALHQDETDPELMFQDYEGFPGNMASECHIAYSALFDHGLASKSDQRFASIRSTG
ncbi:antirestriction protein ArdA, partial [Escherichia coli]|nr:antirestriction protein ArdA [Escherichia coli]